MQVFYPLPVTPNYVRLKKKKKQEEKTSCEKNEEEIEEQGEEEESSVNDVLSSVRRKVSIWKVSKTKRSSISTQRIIFDRLFDDDPATVERRKTVILFDISDSKQRKLEQEKIFGLFISCSKSLSARSSALNADKLNFLRDIVSQFKQFDVKSASGSILKDDKFSDTFIQKILCKRIKENIDIYKHIDTSVIVGNSRWLKLMSWWKMVNGTLERSCSKLHKSLRYNIENKSNNGELIELTNDLQSFLMKTDLLRSSAELSAIRTYVYFDNALPDFEVWLLSKENELGGFQEQFFQVVREDSLWVVFLTQCTEHALNLLLAAVKFLSEREKLSDKSPETVVKNATEAFFLSAVQPLLEGNEEISSDTDKLVEATCKCLEKFFSQVDLQKNSYNETSFETALQAVLQTLMSQMKLMVRHFQGLFYTSDMHISTQYLLRYLKSTILEGIVLAKMSLGKDLLSLDLLLKLATKKDLLTHSPIKFAAILLVCYKVMRRKNQLTFLLPSTYLQYDFEALLNSTLELMDQTRLDILLMEAVCKLRVLQEELTQKLAKSLKMIDKKANAANVLLSKAKYFQSKQTFS